MATCTFDRLRAAFGVARRKLQFCNENAEREFMADVHKHKLLDLLVQTKNLQSEQAEILNGILDDAQFAQVDKELLSKTLVENQELPKCTTQWGKAKPSEFLRRSCSTSWT